MRVAEVWMDEYKEYLYKRRPHYRSIDPGDLTEQKAVRTRLRCKSFKWFMEVVAFDLPKTYPMVEPLNFAEGEVRLRRSSRRSKRGIARRRLTVDRGSRRCRYRRRYRRYRNQFADTDTDPRYRRYDDTEKR